MKKQRAYRILVLLTLATVVLIGGTSTAVGGTLMPIGQLFATNCPTKACTNNSGVVQTTCLFVYVGGARQSCEVRNQGSAAPLCYTNCVFE